MFSKTDIWLFLLAVLGISLTVLHFAEPVKPGEAVTAAHTAQDVIHGLGEAFIIAAVLGFVVDKTAKNSLMDEFARDVSGHIIGRYLPPELRDPIARMLANRLVREDWVIEYNVSEVAGALDALKLQTVSSYSIRNQSNDDQDEVINYEVEKSLIKDGEAAIESVRGQADGEAVSVDFNLSMTNDPRLDTTGDYVSFSDRIVVRANSTYKVDFSSIEYVRTGSILPFFAKQLVMPPCKLRVTHAIGGLRTIVDCSFCTAGLGAPLKDRPGCTEWAFEKPMLPGQGFTVRFTRV